MSLKSSLADHAIRFCVKRDWPWVVSRLLAASCRRVGNPRAKKTVLCIQRSIFVEDVYAMAKATDEVNFILLPKAKLSSILHAICDGFEDFKRLTEYNYHSGCCVEGVTRYREFLGRLISAILKLMPFHAVLSANIGYKEQQELPDLLEGHGIPFLVLFKEGLVVKDKLKTFAARVQNGKKFTGQKVIFYSEQIRDHVLTSTAFAGRSVESAVTGIPRMDHLAKASEPKPKQLVFFSFYPPDKFRCFDGDPEKLSQACEAGDDFHREVVQFAGRNPDWMITIKTKVSSRYIDYVRRFLDEAKSKLPNVVLTSTIPAGELLVDSEAVIAFQSTTCVEALIAGRKLICPDFSSYFEGEDWDYFTEHPQLVSRLTTCEQIEARLKAEDLENSEHLNRLRDDFLQQWVHGADGKASERVVHEILESIETAVSPKQAN